MGWVCRHADQDAAGSAERESRMSSYTLAWILSITLFTLYFFLLITVCTLTFRKGYTVLGIIGIFFPILWLIGAILPAKKGSRQDVAESMRYQATMDQMTR
jgi:hypothetical protein